MSTNLDLAAAISEVQVALSVSGSLLTVLLHPPKAGTLWIPLQTVGL